jgi:hypothetical protein
MAAFSSGSQEVVGIYQAAGSPDDIATLNYASVGRKMSDGIFAM